MIDRIVTALGDADTSAQCCICNALPHLQKLSPADKLRLAAKLEHLAAILRVCSSCQAEDSLLTGKHCPLLAPRRRN